MSNITLTAALNTLSVFKPLKLVVNTETIYNDYDDTEQESFLAAIHKRFNTETFIVNTVNIEIVCNHHSILYVTGCAKS